MEFKHTPEQARALVAKALRSGKYEQGHSALETGSGAFCCLGVACVVYLEVEDEDNHGGVARHHKEHEDIFYGESWEYLPVKVQEWLGFNTTEGAFSGEEVPWKDAVGNLRTGKGLTNMNDSGATFEQIASVFDAPPESMLDLTKGHA